MAGRHKRLKAVRFQTEDLWQQTKELICAVSFRYWSLPFS